MISVRSMQEIQLDKHIKLLDSPGIIMAGGAPDDPAVALRNCVKVIEIIILVYVIICVGGASI